VDDGVEVGEMGQGVEGHVLLFGEGAAHLCRQDGELVGTGGEVVQGAAQDRGGRLAARSRQDHEGGLDLAFRHAFLVVVLDDVRHEVGSLDLPVQAALHFVRDLVIVALLHVGQLLRNGFHQQEVDERVEARGNDEARGLDAVEQELDPGVVARVLQAIERLAEAQVAEDVEGGEVEPRHDIQDGTLPPRRLGRRGPLAEPLDQQRDIPLHNRFLRLEGALREAGAQQPAHPRVALGRGDAEQRVGHARLFAPPDGVLGEGQVARARREDVGPGAGLGEGDLVGRDAQDGAVLAVQLLDVVHDGAVDEGADEGEPRGGPGAGAGEVGERVEVKIVDDLVDGILKSVNV